MGDFQGWKPIEFDEERESASHREPGEEFLFYRAVAAGNIDAPGIPITTKKKFSKEARRAASSCL